MFKRIFVLLVVLALAANVSAALVASYDMEEGSGSTIADGTGSNDGAFDTNAPPVFSTDSAVGTYSIDLGQGGVVPLTTEREAEVELGTFDPRNGTTGDFGISMWFKWQGPSGMWEAKWWSRGQAIMKKMNTWGENTGWMFMIRDWPQSAPNDMGGDDAHFAFLRSGSKAYWDADASEKGLLKKDGSWQFIELFYDNSEEKIGIRVSGNANDQFNWKDFVYSGAGTEPIQIGQNWEGGDRNYSVHGLLDNVGIYDGIPEPATIALLGLGGLLLRRRRKA